MTIRLDGKALALRIEAGLAKRAKVFTRRKPSQAPILASIVVGQEHGPATYLRMKAAACARIGLKLRKVLLPTETTTDELITIIDTLNSDLRVRGIVLSHPLPPEIDERLCFDRIATLKDVDGLTADHFGRMTMGDRLRGSASAAGIMRLLEHYELSVEGKHAVIVGRSPILGKPAAMRLLNANATVTLCHSNTRELRLLIEQADIVVAAAGKPRLIGGSWIRPGAIVIDAGCHPDGSGDVELSSNFETWAAYTPVPGGVGPMTVAVLLEHALNSAEQPAWEEARHW
jgi:methylenetetrahydrofolate dehydrogenase (NADP+)/methenyltetrahydrofolate cyclohydrolase